MNSSLNPESLGFVSTFKWESREVRQTPVALPLFFLSKFCVRLELQHWNVPLADTTESFPRIWAQHEHIFLFIHCCYLGSLHRTINKQAESIQFSEGERKWGLDLGSYFGSPVPLILKVPSKSRSQMDGKGILLQSCETWPSSDAWDSVGCSSCCFSFIS